MSQNISTEQFWNSITDYPGNPMTQMEADFELSRVSMHVLIQIKVNRSKTYFAWELLME
jgi:hypothetical protein